MHTLFRCDNKPINMPHITEYTVQPGDCISSIGTRYGYLWKTLWNANAELRAKRGNPNVLLPGDIIRIPEKCPREELCATDQRHRFMRKGTPAKFRLIVERFGVPLANRRFILVIDGRTSEGTTDSTGMLEVMIDPAANKGRLLMPDDGLECMLELGYLDPVGDLIGVQQRLHNLGFYFGPIDNVFNEDVGDALAAFQSTVNLSATGQLDEATREKLFQMHDKVHPQQTEEPIPPEEETGGDDPEENEADIDPGEDAAEMERFTRIDD